jgi:hypothetical protein
MAKDRPYAVIEIETDPDVPAQGDTHSRTDRIFGTGRAALGTALESGRAAFDSALGTGRAAVGTGRAALDRVPEVAGGAGRAAIGTGRVALDRVPAVAGGARDILVRAQDQVDDMSDMGVVAAAGFAVGVSFGLMMAGVPRVAVIISTIPVALTMRSALARGIRPSRLPR